jgi:uncharacterized protein YbjQ (UPF0145 family)
LLGAEMERDDALAIARDPETDSDTLGKLVFSEDPAVVAAVVQHPSTPMWAIKRASNRSEAQIADAVESRREAIQESLREPGAPPKPETPSPSAQTRKADVLVVTTDTIPNQRIVTVMGLVFSTQSKVAIGLNKQQTRLAQGLVGSLRLIKAEAAGRGANAIVGLHMASNSSQGSSAAFFGSSDAIVLFGTAVLAVPLEPSHGMTCPFCREGVHREAVKCKHCGEFLNNADSSSGG